MSLPVEEHGPRLVSGSSHPGWPHLRSSAEIPRLGRRSHGSGAEKNAKHQADDSKNSSTGLRSTPPFRAETRISRSQPVLWSILYSGRSTDFRVGLGRKRLRERAAARRPPAENRNR